MLEVINKSGFGVTLGRGEGNSEAEKKSGTWIAHYSKCDINTPTTANTGDLQLSIGSSDGEEHAGMVGSGLSDCSTLNDHSRITRYRLNLNRRLARKGKGQWQPVEVQTILNERETSTSPSGQPSIWAMKKIINSTGVTQVILFSTRSASSYMSCLPDTTRISSMCIPGTHETFARYWWPISKCQEVSSTITKQLEDGIRFMDLRVTPQVDAEGRRSLWAYHGSRPQYIELGDALKQLYDFLDGTGSRETVIISLKPEKGDPELMQSLLFDLYINPNFTKWWLHPRIPGTLSEVRGKLILFSRFGHYNTEPGGIHPPLWPNNYKGTFSYELLTSKQKVNTQDWFNIGCYTKIPDKFDLVKQLLDESGNDENVFALDFVSCATFPWATPTVTAKGWWESGPNLVNIQGMNSRLQDYLLDIIAKQVATPQKDIGPSSTIPGLQACFAIDFYDYQGAAQLIPLLIEANFTQ